MNTKSCASDNCGCLKNDSLNKSISITEPSFSGIPNILPFKLIVPNDDILADWVNKYKDYPFDDNLVRKYKDFIDEQRIKSKDDINFFDKYFSSKLVTYKKEISNNKCYELELTINKNIKIAKDDIKLSIKKNKLSNDVNTLSIEINYSFSEDVFSHIANMKFEKTLIGEIRKEDIKSEYSNNKLYIYIPYIEKKEVVKKEESTNKIDIDFE